MNNYYELRFDLNPCSEDMTDLLASFLADEGFESFVPDNKGLTAFVKEEVYDPETIKMIVSDFPFDSEIRYTANFVEGKDWNEEWEKNYFKPIVIADKCVVRSSFHQNAPKAEIEILIDPKMAFGTGHHATTTMMASRLLNNPPKGKSVIDMGTGTGILAMLASKLGASEVTGIEIDPMAYENATENASLNHCNINLILGDASSLKELSPADILLANINRNIILSDIERYAKALKSGGVMYLSGFYPVDADMIYAAAQSYGLADMEMTTLGEWASVKLVKNQK
ncbi:MAG: 50S ribosomal protein L11 methyltransferase [Muribaculum sp.]|nr:50S ribosomal protein L11 methyltransferase [Muribaculum sp.]